MLLGYAIAPSRFAPLEGICKMVKPYSGEELRSQLPRQLDWHNTYVVIVTGAKLNPCGHALLNIGAVGGYYFHVAEVYGHPRYMVEAGYRRYL